MPRAAEPIPDASASRGRVIPGVAVAAGLLLLPYPSSAIPPEASEGTPAPAETTAGTVAPSADTAFSQNRFALVASGDFEPASGLVRLTPVWSPFGVAVSPEGHFQYHLELSVADLPPAASAGGERYVAWLTDPSLERVHPLGAVRNDDPVSADVGDWNKFIVLVSVEGSETPERWSGPIALVGRSRSAEMRSLVGHSVFDRPEF